MKAVLWVALCWLVAQATADNLVQTRTEKDYPSAWNTATILQDGVYFVSATVDARKGDSTVASVNVTANGRILFQAITREVTTNAGMAFTLKAGDTIKAVKAGVKPGRLHCRLTVAFVSPSPDDTKFTSRKTVGTTAMFRPHWDLVNFTMGWGFGGEGWSHLDPAETYYQISRSSTYWVMASAAGFVPEGDVRQLLVCYDTVRRRQPLCYMMFILYTVSEYATSAAAAFNLRAQHVVFMKPRRKAQQYRDVLFSLLELRPPSTGRYQDAPAVTGTPQVSRVSMCKKFKGALTDDIIGKRHARAVGAAERFPLTEGVDTPAEALQLQVNQQEETVETGQLGSEKNEVEENLSAVSQSSDWNKEEDELAVVPRESERNEGEERLALVSQNAEGIREQSSDWEKKEQQKLDVTAHSSEGIVEAAVVSASSELNEEQGRSGMVPQASDAVQQPLRRSGYGMFIPDNFLLYFPVTRTDHGFMIPSFGDVITIKISGIYLLSMRPHKWSGDGGSKVGMLMSHDRVTSDWVVVTEQVTSGETIALRLAENTRLWFYLFHSDACKIGIYSMVSVAMAKDE